MKAAIASLRAEMNAKLDALERIVDEETAESGDDSPWMKVPVYAKYARVSPDTVRRWIDGGMRAAGGAVGKGKLTRVQRDLADRWRTSR
jgi:hypothetical protein